MEKIMKEIRFKQITCTFDGVYRKLYGLTEDGRVYRYDESDVRFDWIPMFMRIEEEQ